MLRHPDITIMQCKTWLNVLVLHLELLHNLGANGVICKSVQLNQTGHIIKTKRPNESDSSLKVTKSSSGSRSSNDSDKSLVNCDDQEDWSSRTHEDQGPSPWKSLKEEPEA
ncbi:hypothetical protein Tco_1401026 [Tanacetum coccineum]